MHNDPDSIVLALFREAGLRPPSIHEVKELQTGMGLVAAEVGVCLVPSSVERLRRDNVTYRPMDAVEAVSPIIMSSRKGDRSPERVLMLKLIKQMYVRQKENILAYSEKAQVDQKKVSEFLKQMKL